MNTNPEVTIDSERHLPDARALHPVGFFHWLFEELRWLLRVLVSAADRFYWDNGFSKAASLAYSTLFALVPLTVLAFGLLGSFALSAEHVPQVREFVFRQFVPEVAVVNEVIQHLATFSQALSSLNMLAVVFIVLTVLLLINSIEFALNEIWQVYEPRTWSQRIGIYCAIVVLAPVMAISAYYFARFQIEGLFDGLGYSSYFLIAYTTTLPFLIDFLAFALLYFLVPKAPVRLRSAVFGAIAGALLFGAAKSAFAFYVTQFSSYDRIYGALASIPIVLFWLYLAWSIVLFGAELSYQAQYLPRIGNVWRRSVMQTGDGILVIGAQALLIIARAFRKGTTLPNDLEIAEKIGCSSVLLKPALDALERAGIVQRGEGHSVPISLMRAPNTITLAQIQQALARGRTELLFPVEVSRVFHAFRDPGSRHLITLESILDGTDPQSHSTRSVS